MFSCVAVLASLRGGQDFTQVCKRNECIFASKESDATKKAADSILLVVSYL